MKYNTGEIVKLKDDGKSEYIVLHTKESGDNFFTKTAFDYVVKKTGGNKKDGEYLRHVFEENMYEA